MAYCQMCADKEVEISTLRARLEKAEKVVEAAKGCGHGDYCSEEACYCGYDKVEQALYVYRAALKSAGKDPSPGRGRGREVGDAERGKKVDGRLWRSAK